MTVNRGDIVVIDQPFSSGDGSKVRPVLVLQNDRDNGRMTNTIVAMITRTVRAELTQLPIDPNTPQGKACGLIAPSAINCSNLFTIDQRLIRKKIGALPAELWPQVEACLRQALHLA